MTETWHPIGNRYELSTHGRLRRRMRTSYFYMAILAKTKSYTLDLGDSPKKTTRTAQVLARMIGIKIPDPVNVDWIKAQNKIDNANPEKLPDIGPNCKKRLRREIKPYAGKPLMEMRKCTPCGRPTFAWRCPECWRKVNAANGISESMGHPGDEYRLPW